MRTLLIGPDGDECQRALEGALRAEGHDVQCAPDARTARAAWDEAPVPFIILARPGDGALQFCRHVRRKSEAPGERTTDDPIVLAVASEPARALSLQALTDAGVDEMIFDCEDPGRLRAQLTLAAERVQRRAQRTRAEAELRRRAGSASRPKRPWRAVLRPLLAGPAAVASRSRGPSTKPASCP